MTDSTPYLSVVIPLYNESETVAGTVEAIVEAIEPTGREFEIVLVDDGSTDGTGEKIAELGRADARLRPAGYPANAGRGKALRTGFAAALGRLVATIDADLSYHPAAILDLLAALDEHPDADFAVGSPYMPGGRTENVPAMRLLVSKLGNRVLRWLMPGGYRTYTGIFRCYRRRMLRSLVLDSNGKEIHLEILTKAQVLGFKGVEVPATLRSRQRGSSKFRFRRTAISHVLHGVHERPMVIFGIVGLVLLCVGMGLGAYLLILSLSGMPVGDRPLLQFVVFLTLAAMLMMAIGFLAIQNVVLRNELYKIASQNKQLAERMANVEDTGEEPGEQA